jgi:altronate dehydratase small subunit
MVLNPNDNVATVVRPLEKDEHILLTIGGKLETVILEQSIPFGHKFAIRDIYHGGDVIKYGETIGIATADILIGEHVHLHNVEGTRGRGDHQ